jgi:citrate lyase subunit beta/citryl-CoA lyase
LYVPGNRRELIEKCKKYNPDSLILDLEDAVPPQEKERARDVVREALLSIDFGHIEKTVRINSPETEDGEKDLEAILPAKPDCIRIPKVETAREIVTLNRRMEETEKAQGFPKTSITIIPILETATGVWNAYEILSGCSRIIGVAIGAEDLMRDLGMPSREKMVLSWIRILVKVQAAAAKVAAFDGVYSNFNDLEGLRAEACAARDWGYEGKSVIHPKQIPVVNEVFSPTKDEIEYASRVSEAFQRVVQNGGGVANLDGKMIDKPVYERAQKILEKARLLNLS